jgi:hypothetical protein
VPYAPEIVRSVNAFRMDMSKISPNERTADHVEVRFSDDESVIFVGLRIMSADVLLRRLPVEEARAKVAEIAGLFRGENFKDPQLDELIEDVENSCFYIEAEDRGEVRLDELAL